MRNSTFWSTILIAAGLGIGVVFLFFPQKADQIVSSIRVLVNPKHIDMVKLEYTAADPARSRGWQVLRIYETADQCMPALTRDYSRDVTVAAPIGQLRCASYRRTGEIVQVLRTHQPGS